MRRFIWISFITALIFFAVPLPVIPGINITLSDLIFIIIFILVIIENIFTKNVVSPIFNQNYWYIWIIFMLLGTGSLLSAMSSTNPISALTNFIQYIFIFFVLITVLDYLFNSKVNNISKIIFLTIIPGVILSIIINLSYFQIFNSIDHIILSDNGRYVGFEGIATEFGNKMALYATISIYGIVFLKKKMLRIAFVILTLVFIFTSFLSGSFGTILIVYVTILFYLLFYFKGKIFPRVIAIGSIIFVIYQYYSITINYNYGLLYFLPEIMQTRFINLGNNFGSLDSRIEINSLAINDFFNSPFIGVGYGQYPYNNVLNLSVHNTFLSAAVEIGIFGLLGVSLYVILPIVMSGILYYKYNPNKKYQMLISFLIVYSLVRFVNTFKAQEYIDREPWIPVLMIFILFANRNHLTNRNKVNI